MWKIHRHPIILTWDWSLQKAYQITCYALLTPICLDLKMQIVFSSFGLQSTLNSFISTKNGNVSKFSAEWRNLQSPRSWCSVNGEDRTLWNCWLIQHVITYMVYHSFIQFVGHLSDNGRWNQREKNYDFKFKQISVDRALKVFISDIPIKFSVDQLVKESVQLR